MLKYQVPAPARDGGDGRPAGDDLIRSRAGEWRVDPDSIGFLGFSAGGELGVWLLTHSDERLYPEADAADAVPCRPNFVALAYSGGLLQRRHVEGTAGKSNSSRIAAGVLTHAFDDSSQESLALALALKRAGVPTEVHVFREGGHGFGVATPAFPPEPGRTGTWNGWAAWGIWIVRPFREQTRAVWRRRPNRAAPAAGDGVDSRRHLGGCLCRAASMGPMACGHGSRCGIQGCRCDGEGPDSAGIDGPLAGVVFRSGWLDGRSIR